jgi:hypothetical protein
MFGAQYQVIRGMQALDKNKKMIYLSNFEKKCKDKMFFKRYSGEEKTSKSKID